MANHRPYHYDSANAERAPETVSLTKDYDGFEDEGDNRLRRVPTHSFDTSESTFAQSELEDGRSSLRWKRNWWTRTKDIVTVKSKRIMSRSTDGIEGGETAYKDGLANDEAHGLLPDIDTTRRLRRKRNYWNYCVLGGISGLTILFVHIPCRLRVID